MVLCCPHQLTAFFVLTQRRISVRHSQVNHNWRCDSFSDLRKVELSSVMSGSERLPFIRGSKNIFIILLVPCSPSNMEVTKSQKLRRAGCIRFGDCPGILAHAGDKGEGGNKRHFPSHQHWMSAIADCKPPCCFAVWCFEWVFTWLFHLFKICTVVKLFLKVRMVRSFWKKVEYCTPKHSRQSATPVYSAELTFC